jgi:hypothetical protein
MDISRLVDFSGDKPVLKQGGSPVQFIPIAPPVKEQSWVKKRIRSIFSKLKRILPEE